MWRLRQHATKWIHMWLRSRSFWLNSNAANWCQYAAPQTCEYGRAKKGEQRARRKKFNQMCRLYVFILDRKYRILRHPYIIESKKDWFTSVCYVSIEHEFWGAFQRERRKTISSIFIRIEVEWEHIVEMALLPFADTDSWYYLRLRAVCRAVFLLNRKRLRWPSNNNNCRSINRKWHYGNGRPLICHLVLLHAYVRKLNSIHDMRSVECAPQSWNVYTQKKSFTWMHHFRIFSPLNCSE